MISDSDSDVTNNVFIFQNQNTTISAKGPNINTTNLSSISFRNNVMTSTMQLPKNFERSRAFESSLQQQSTYYERPTSTMSLCSGDNRMKNNLYQPYNNRGMSSSRSIINGRSGSPMSMRSIDSTASVSATEIALALKNTNFNRHDFNIIKDAYNKFMKHRVRKKIEKRRKLRMLAKVGRRRSGYDSGEQGSNSSLSSDEDKSTITSTYKDNVSTSKSIKTDISDFRKTMNRSNIYKDCTERFRQNTFRNMLGLATGSVKNLNNTVSESQITQPCTQNKRFNGFVLPSQRFGRPNSTVVETIKTISSNNNNSHVTDNNKLLLKNSKELETDSEPEIFSEVTVKENVTKNDNRQKRVIDKGDGILLPDEKRRKLLSLSSSNTSAVDKNHEAKNNSNSNFSLLINDHKTNDFIFAKPTLPFKKLAGTKAKEVLISKSAQPIVTAEKVNTMPQSLQNVKHADVPKQAEVLMTADDQVSTHNVTDDSVRPSFIKRKLFTQKLDVTEKKNISNESLSSNSPHTNIYSSIQKEKNKARKLVTSQSCLSREVLPENNNLLDLIHKIVPPDRMNITNVTNKSEVTNRKSQENDSQKDKWDITSIISTCNKDDVSDTYTDDEIFMSFNKQNVKTTKAAKENSPKTYKDCRIIVEKLPVSEIPQYQMPKAQKAETTKDPCATTNLLQACIKSFWDTDFESDNEGRTSYTKKNDVKNHPADYKQDLNRNKINKNTMEPTTTKIVPAQEIKKINHTMTKLNVSHIGIRSHRTPKRKKYDDTKSIVTSKHKENLTKLKDTNSLANSKHKENPTNPNDTDSIANLNDKGNLTKPKNTKSIANSKDKEIPTKPKGMEAIGNSKDKENPTKLKDTNYVLNSKDKENLTKPKHMKAIGNLKDKENPTKPKQNIITALKLSNNSLNNESMLQNVNKSIDRPLRTCRKSRANNNSLELSKSDKVQNVSKINRPLRNCRKAKENNSTLELSTSDKCKNTKKNMNKSRQLRQAQTSSNVMMNGMGKRKDDKTSNCTNNPKPTAMKTRASDVSFSGISENMSQLFDDKDKTSRGRKVKSKIKNDEFKSRPSDVSFSLRPRGKPTNNKIISQNNNTLNKSTLQNISLNLRSNKKSPIQRKKTSTQPKHISVQVLNNMKINKYLIC